MYRRAYRKAICLSQKLGRNTQSERKGMKFFSNEEEHNESETLYYIHVTKHKFMCSRHNEAKSKHWSLEERNV